MAFGEGWKESLGSFTGVVISLLFAVDIFIDPSAALRTFASLQHARMVRKWVFFW